MKEWLQPGHYPRREFGYSELLPLKSGPPELRLEIKSSRADGIHCSNSPKIAMTLNSAYPVIASTFLYSVLVLPTFLSIPLYALNQGDCLTEFTIGRLPRTSSAVKPTITVGLGSTYTHTQRRGQG